MPLRYNDTPTPPKIEEVNSNTSQPTGGSERGSFDFAPVGPGNPKYLTGPPLAEINAIPFRGAGMAAHGMDVDTLRNEWEEHAGPGEMTGGGEGVVEFIDPDERFNKDDVDPLIVTVLDMPIETQERYSRIIPFFSGREPYSFTSVGVFDTSPVRTIMPKDDTRRSVTIYALPTPEAMAATGSAQYAFLISNDQSCQTGIILGSNVANSPNSVTLLGKSPVFARLIPLAAQDPTKVNNYYLAGIAETTNVGQRRIK